MATVNARELARAVDEVVRTLLPEGGDLERGVLAMRLADAAERRSRAFVATAHAAGASWTDVGDAFGTSRAAAWERFSGGPDGGRSRYTHRGHSRMLTVS